MTEPLHVLILCSDAAVGSVLPELDHRFRCMTIRGAEASELWFSGPTPDAIVLAGGDAAEPCLERLRLQYPTVPLLWLDAVDGAGERSLPAGVTCMDGRAGPDAVAERIVQLMRSRTVLDTAAPEETNNPGMLGRSAEMEAARHAIGLAADTDVTVLLRGESGTGKEVAARCLWRRSHRARFPFIKVNCAAIPCELLESELFGYEAGAFTGAIRQKAGKFELAHRGTIFLDEISEMHPLLQAKLLHVLQDGEFCRLGGRQSCSADVRVLAATNIDLEAAVASGRFRRDLFYRLSVVNITLPPLRRRGDDVVLLLDYYCRHYAARYRRPLRSFRPASLDILRRYSWPGNVRELENLAKRLLVMGDERQILLDLATLPARLGVEAAARVCHAADLSGQGTTLPWETDSGNGAAMTISGRRSGERPAGETPLMEKQSLLEIGRQAAQQAEAEAILQALQQTRWNRRQAAELLQVSYKALQNKMKGIDLGAAASVASAGRSTPMRPQ